jgi:hypothetical protein
MLGFIIFLFALSLVAPWVFPNSKVSSSPYDAQG